jgi:hypothetical protein
MLVSEAIQVALFIGGAIGAYFLHQNQTRQELRKNFEDSLRQEISQLRAELKEARQALKDEFVSAQKIAALEHKLLVKHTVDEERISGERNTDQAG